MRLSGVAPVSIDGVDLRLTELQADPLPSGHVPMPYDHVAGFDDDWWLRTIPAGPVFCTFTDGPDGPEVARAYLLFGSDMGIAWPTFAMPPGGTTEIVRFEVRQDRWSEKIGVAAAALLTGHYPGPLVANSLDTNTDGFWRAIGWTWHEHPDRFGTSLFVFEP